MDGYLYLGPDRAHGRDGGEGPVGGAGHLLERRRRQRVRTHGVSEDSHVGCDIPVGKLKIFKLYMISCFLLDV